MWWESQQNALAASLVLIEKLRNRKPTPKVAAELTKLKEARDALAAMS